MILVWIGVAVTAASGGWLVSELGAMARRPKRRRFAEPLGKVKTAVQINGRRREYWNV